MKTDTSITASTSSTVLATSTEFRLAVKSCAGVFPVPNTAIVRIDRDQAQWLLELCDVVRQCGASSMDYAFDDVTWVRAVRELDQVLPRVRADLFVTIHSNGVRWKAVRNDLVVQTQMLTIEQLQLLTGELLPEERSWYCPNGCEIHSAKYRPECGGCGATMTLNSQDYDAVHDAIEAAAIRRFEAEFASRHLPLS